jgi:ABC-type nickel/cobalt efflux system permease component RcnA
MLGLDQLIGGLAHGQPAAVVLAIAVLLGLRHASDPDHLVAVSTLVATEPERRARRAGLLGLAWGAGHATTLVLLGAPVVLLGSFVPDRVQRGLELVVGLVIVALALRLLVRWRRGSLHVHGHRHGDATHRHLHAHRAGGDHGHEHAHALVRSPVQGFAIGLVHGAGGSAPVGLLLLAAIGDRGVALGALFLFAGATAVSMAVLSSGLGYALGTAAVRARFAKLAPALALLALAFGAWYAAGAAGA